MILDQWAIRWGINPAAIQDLKQALLALSPEPTPGEAVGESEVQNEIRAEATQKGCRLLRNNSGVAFTKTGRPVRYGLGNDSKRINRVFKSADLIGVRPVLITPAMVGATIGQLLVREVKKPNWKFRGTEEEQGQLNFINFCVAMGADAKFANRVGTI